MTTQLQFRILGPLEVSDSGRVIDLGPARQRALLAALLLRRNEVVSTDRLLDDIWGERPPPSAAHALQVYVSNLRKLLEPGRTTGTRAALLTTRRPGYLLAIASGQLDAARFEAEVGGGRRELMAGRPEAAAATLRVALGLWRGPALADLADEPFCAAEAARLEEMRLAATADRIEADLAMGLHEELTGELDTLVGRHPLRERLWGQLMLALYRSGRQADALHAYQRVRSLLDDELGLEPGPALRDLEGRILRQEGDLELSPPPPREAPPVTAAGRGRPERRQVTALSAELIVPPGLDARIEAAERTIIIDGAAEILKAGIDAYGGIVPTSTPDGIVLGLFGAAEGHEDDSERAVRAALRVADELATYGGDVARAWDVEPLRVRIGVHAGPVVLMGGAQVSWPGESSMETVDRVRSAAPPGSVLVSEATRRIVGPLFAWGGLIAPVGAYNVIGEMPTSGKVRGLEGREVELVGRDRELATAKESLDEVLAGTGGVLFVAGEAGVGKSRLLAELRRRFEAAESTGGGGVWLEGHCVSYGQSLAYWPFRELLREWLGTSPQQPQLRTRVTLRLQVERLFGEAGELHPLLATILGLPLERETADVLASRTPDSLQTGLFGACRRLIERLAQEGPVVVAIDDVQWADPTSLQLLEHLLQCTETAAVLLVVAGRPERDHASWHVRETAGRRFGHRTREIPLEALAAEPGARMVTALLGPTVLAPGVTDRLLDIAEGNPFFIEELVGSLIQEDSRAGTGQVPDPDAFIQLPQTVESVLVSRIGRLSAPSRDVLAAASVLGRQFGVELVEGMCDPGLEVAEALGELQRLDLVREVRRWPQREYRFKHGLIQEAAYRMLVEEWRQELHRRAAHVLETLVPDRVAESYGLLAQHCLRSGQTQRAVAYHRLAGDAARRVHAVGEALEHYTSGVDLAATLPSEEADAGTMAGLHVGRAMLWWHRGDERAGDEFEAALATSRQAGNRAIELEALEGCGWVESAFHGRRSQAIRRFQEAFHQARESGDDGAAVALANRLAVEHVNRLELDRALEWGQEALAAAVRVGGDRARARAMDGLKLVAATVGDFATLRDLTSQLEVILPAHEDLWFLQFALAEASLEAAGRGRFDEATVRLDQALAVNERLANPNDRAYILLLRAWVERSRGSYGQALQLAREAVDCAAQKPQAQWLAWAETNLGAGYLELGVVGEAIAHLERGSTVSQQGAVRTQYVRCCSHLAWAYLQQGDLQLSGEQLELAQLLLGEVTTPPGKAWLQGIDAYVDVARTLVATGQAPRVPALLEPVLAAAEESGWCEAVAGTALALASCRSDGSDEPLVRRALEAAEAGGLRPLAWQAHAALGHLLQTRGERQEASKHLGEARRIVFELAGSIDDPDVRDSFFAQALHRLEPGAPAPA